MVEDVEEPRDSKGSKDMALAEVVLFITDSVMEKTGTTWHDIVQAGSWAMLVPHFWIKKSTLPHEAQILARKMYDKIMILSLGVNVQFSCYT